MDQEPVFPSAADLDAAAIAPELEPTPGAEETPDWAAIAAQERAEKEALAAQFQSTQQKVSQLEQFQQQAMLAQSQAAFQQEERDFFQRIEGLDQESYNRATRDFYAQQNEQRMAAMQDVTRRVAVNGYADMLIRELGLTPDDRVLLGDNPDLMPMIAGNLSQQRQQTAELRSELERRKAADQARQFVGNPATRSSGGQGAIASTANYEPGSLEHMKAALAGLA